MPRRHSQNNTAGAIFTHYEKSQLKEYGTQKQRLSKDSLKPFDACTVCLQSVINPLTDKDGSIYCKACIYQYLLDQKNHIKKLKKEYIKQKKELKEEKTEKQKKEERIKSEAFQEREKGLFSSNSGKSKQKINNFWLPSATPIHITEKLKKPSKVILSPTGHPIKLKDLIPINLMLIPKEKTTNNDDEEKIINDRHLIARYMCPTCSKVLNNVSGVICITTSGNVFCKHCMDTVIKKDMIDPIANIHFDELDLLTLRHEGTSFSGRSGASLEAVKHTPAPRL